MFERFAIGEKRQCFRTAILSCFGEGTRCFENNYTGVTLNNTGTFTARGQSRFGRKGSAMKKALLQAATLLLAVSSFAQSTHSVVLNWTASSDAKANPTLTYNVYRAPGNCSDPLLPKPIKINSTPVRTVSFIDTSVSEGNSYCYIAKSALNGLESVPSNTAQAVILPSPHQASTQRK